MPYMGGGAPSRGRRAPLLQQVGARRRTCEAAMLLEPVQAPTKYAAHQPARRACRANVVLDNLVDAGFMTEGQVFGARRNPAVAVDRRDRIRRTTISTAFDEMRKLVDTFRNPTLNVFSDPHRDRHERTARRGKYHREQLRRFDATVATTNLHRGSRSRRRRPRHGRRTRLWREASQPRDRRLP